MTRSAAQSSSQRGFTLVEIAIVLVVIGLLIGGILRGQEMINSARVRNIMDQQKAIQVAFYAFQDRYNALPGDLTLAQAVTVKLGSGLLSDANLGGALVATNTSATDFAGDGWVPINDSPEFFNNLAQAGLISCSQCMTPTTSGTTGGTTLNSPYNFLGRPLYFTYPNPATMPNSNAAGSFYLSTMQNEGTKPMLSTGDGIDSRLLAEMDRKDDDGAPATGKIRYSDFFSTASGHASLACVTPSLAAQTSYAWLISPPAICQGVSLF
ncbi:MAG: prepilin-type N-terminal cleavage/methylation domain-containing protein [Cytophagales bacterium]|nr:prepilin-type N-terminal cleavage/methylation domain-containing protein [Cytophagales bacterium]